MKVLDANSEMHGIPPAMLMENAGREVARYIVDEHSPGKVLIICGPGNNGGDGYVTARRLSEEGIDVLLLPIKDPTTRLAREAAEKASGHYDRISLDELQSEVGRVDVVIDAMLGAGLRGSLREPYGRVVRTLNNVDVPVVSVDVPTGLGTDRPLRPAITLTFHDIKEGMEGMDVKVVDIGIPEGAGTHTGPGELTLIPNRETGSHKGDLGKVLVVGGGPFSGAPALAAMGAMRTGCDLAVVATPSHVAPIVAGFSPNLIVRSLPGEYLAPAGSGQLVEVLGEFDSVVIGPGLGDHQLTVQAVKELVTAAGSNGVPVVIDADALKIFRDLSVSGVGYPGVLTPHRGEIAGLTDLDDPEDAAISLSVKSGYAVLLKGREDLIVHGELMRRNSTGNPGMTVGGTGDVLAGSVGALLAIGLEPFDAARVGAYVVGRAGDLAYEHLGNSLLATDIVDTIPDALKGPE